MSDPHDGSHTLLLALAAVLTIVICALTVLYVSGPSTRTPPTAARWPRNAPGNISSPAG